MTMELLFGAQVLSFVGYLGSLFYVYRGLVAQKDATIENLKNRLDEADKKSPDYLLDKMRLRVAMLEDESKRSDNENSGRAKEIAALNVHISTLESEIGEIKEIASEYFCPYCGSPLVDRGYATESVQFEDSDGEVDHSWERFSCGFRTADDQIIERCPKQGKDSTANPGDF